jgi:hypothetical protein
MKIEKKLAAAFKTLAAQGSQIESTASGVLAIVKSANAVNEQAFDALIELAYEANGWNAKVGRPTAGAKKLEAAPETVRTYVTTVRRAIRIGLRVGSYDTFTALRTALERKTQPRLVRSGRKARKGSKKAQVATNGHARIPKAVENDFVGISIEGNPRDPNGALFHDLAATFIKLPPEPRSDMGRELSQLLHKYLPKAGVPTLAAARQPQRKAA